MLLGCEDARVGQLLGQAGTVRRVDPSDAVLLAVLGRTTAPAREHRLVVQRCADCKSLRHPPGPCCPQCGSFAWDTVESSGRGHVYTFTVNHHPRHPAFDYPLVVAVIELAEGTRLIANMAGVEPADVEVGMPVVLDWIDPDPDLSLPVFRPAAHEER